MSSTPVVERYRLNLILDPRERLIRYNNKFIGRLTINEFNAIDLLRIIGEPYRLTSFGELIRSSENAGLRRAYAWRKSGLLNELIRLEGKTPTPVYYVYPSDVAMDLYEEADFLLLSKPPVRKLCETWAKHAERWMREERMERYDKIRAEREAAKDGVAS